jgi:hypothetical protein
LSDALAGDGRRRPVKSDDGRRGWNGRDDISLKPQECLWFESDCGSVMGGEGSAPSRTRTWNPLIKCHRVFESEKAENLGIPTISS